MTTQPGSTPATEEAIRLVETPRVELVAEVVRLRANLAQVTQELQDLRASEYMSQDVALHLIKLFKPYVEPGEPNTLWAMGDKVVKLLEAARARVAPDAQSGAVQALKDALVARCGFCAGRPDDNGYIAKPREPDSFGQYWHSRPEYGIRTLCELKANELAALSGPSAATGEAIERVAPNETEH